jgi:hypothetical protein
MTGIVEQTHIGALQLIAEVLHGGVESGVLSENHIRTYWWCSPARIGMATMAPDRWTARCKGCVYRKPKPGRIANIAVNDAMILPYNANPGRMEFSERTGDESCSE